MATIFDLKQSVLELPTLNSGTNNLRYVLRPPTRPVAGDKFENGLISFKFAVSGTNWWIPSRTYLRLRCTITSVEVAGAAPVQPSLSSDLAPAMGLCACLFQKMEFRMKDKTVSRIESNVAQCDALEKRMGKTKAWLEGPGRDLELWEPRFDIRSSQISKDGITKEDEVFPEGFLALQQNRVAQGFDAPAAANRNSITIVGPVVTFTQTGGAAIPDIQNIYFPGDKLMYLGIIYTVEKVLTVASMQISPSATEGVASNIEWSRLPSNAPLQDRVAQGFDAQAAANSNNIEVSAAGLITFAVNGGAALPNLINLYQEGDEIIYLGISYFVRSVLVASPLVSVNIAPPVAAVAVASNVTWYLRRKKLHNAALRRNQIELIWTPPLSIFKVQQAIPSCECELILNPENLNSLKARAVESFHSSLRVIPGVGASLVNDFNFQVDSLDLYTAQIQGPRVSENITYFLSLEQTRCQVSQIDSGADQFQLRQFEVSPSTYALTIAFQDSEATATNTLFSPSKLKIRSVPGYTDAAFSLTRVFVNYSNEIKPSPDGQPDYATPKDFLKQRYADSIIYSGGYFSAGATESFTQWLDRGIYMHWAWPKDGDARNTRAEVSFQLKADTLGKGRILMYDHYRKMLIISIRNGRIDRIIEQDA